MSAAAAAPLLHMHTQQLRNGRLKSRDSPLQRGPFLIFFFKIFSLFSGRSTRRFYICSQCENRNQFSCWEQNSCLSVRVEICSHAENRFMFSACEQIIFFLFEFKIQRSMNSMIQNPRLTINMNKKKKFSVNPIFCSHKQSFSSREQKFCSLNFFLILLFYLIWIHNSNIQKCPLIRRWFQLEIRILINLGLEPNPL